MTLPMEFEEAPEVDAGARLITVPCVGCGADALCASAMRSKAKCTGCWGGSAPDPSLAGKYWHPGGWSTRGPADSPSLEKPPPPVVPAREMPFSGMDMPGPVAALDRFARTFGWSTKIMYSRGYAARYRGEWQEEEIITVRFGAHPRSARQALAVYRTIAGKGTWTWRSVWLWGPALPPFGLVGVTGLKLFLARPAASDAVVTRWCGWVRTAPEWKENQRAARWIVALNNPWFARLKAAAIAAAAPKEKKSKRKEGAS